MLVRIYEDKVCEGKGCERRNLKTKPTYNYALAPPARSPARHFEKVLTSSHSRWRFRHLTHFLTYFMSLSQTSTNLGQ